MDFLVIENYRGTDLGLMGRIAAADGFRWKTVAAWQGDAVPADIGAFRGLVVLGGAQNALADDDYPFLPEVCALIREFHRRERPVLGICLGCQLIARAFGGENILDRPVEFGWQRVVQTPEGEKDPVLRVLQDGSPLFHWHSDTVGLPGGAVHLAASGMTPFQAFRVGQTTYAIQFHFETGLEDVRRWSETFPDDIRAHTPDWQARFETEAARYAAEADATGAALSRAWLALL